MKSHPIVLAVQPESTDHVRGPSHARVTLIEYGDFESAACKGAVPTLKLLLEQHPNKIRFIFRHFPNEQGHPQAVLAAEAAEAAAAQGKFWEMHDLLFQHQPHFAPKELQAYAAAVGLDTVRYTAEMDDHIYLQKVREQIDGAHRSHLHASPAFFVGAVHQDTTAGMRQLHETIAQAMHRAG